MFYYLFRNGEREAEPFMGEYVVWEKYDVSPLDLWIRLDGMENFQEGENLNDLKGKYSYTDLMSIFTEKVKEISLIKLFAFESYKRLDLVILARLLNDMQETNGLYIWIQ